MFDTKLVIEILLQIKDSINKVSQRFSVIKSIDDFTDSPEGLEKLDSICMQLIAIGESVKNINKITDRNLLVQ